MNRERITLPQYAARMNIKLLRPADFNERSRERGVDKRLTVQRICRVCKDESEVRDVLDRVWNEPVKTKEILAETMGKNQNVFGFEEDLNCLTRMIDQQDTQK